MEWLIYCSSKKCRLIVRVKGEDITILLYTCTQSGIKYDFMWFIRLMKKRKKEKLWCLLSDLRNKIKIYDYTLIYGGN